MASIRKLKKDINFLTNEVIETCMIKLYFNPETDKEKIFKIVEDFVDFRNDTIYKLNNPDKINGKNKIRPYYNNIFNKFIEEVNKAFEKLNGLNKEKAEIE